MLLFHAHFMSREVDIPVEDRVKHFLASVRKMEKRELAAAQGLWMLSEKREEYIQILREEKNRWIIALRETCDATGRPRRGRDTAPMFAAAARLDKAARYIDNRPLY